MLLWFYNVNKHEILLLSSKGSVKAKKMSNLTAIKPMFVMFPDTWQNYAATYCLCSCILVKNSSKRNVIKENYHSNKFLNYLLAGFTKFLNGIPSSIQKVISPKLESICFIFFFFFEKSKCFLDKTYQLKTVDMNFKGSHLGCLLL